MRLGLSLNIDSSGVETEASGPQMLFSLNPYTQPSLIWGQSLA
jgi:hypothetical protein